MRRDPGNMEKSFPGDEKTFSHTFDQYYPALCFYADKYLHDPDESRSLVQQVFVDLWMKRDHLEISNCVRSYLFTTVKHYVLDRIRHQAVEHRYLEKFRQESAGGDDQLIDEAELNARLQAAIGELPPRCREIFLLCRFEELKYREIAEKLDISIKTVEMQMGIALKRLRSKLTDDQHLKLLLFVISKKS